MKLFSIKNKAEPRKRRLKVPGWMIRRQRIFAGYLQTKTARWRDKEKRSFLVVFCCVSLGASFGITWKAFKNEGHETIVFAERIAVPMVIGPEEESYHPVFKQGILTGFPRLRKQLDSLMQRPEGRSFKDSLDRTQPGLLDSLYKFDLLPIILK